MNQTAVSGPQSQGAPGLSQSGSRSVRRTLTKPAGIIRSEQALRDVHELLDRMYSKHKAVHYELANANRRSVEQNRLQRLWVKEAAQQLQDETAEDKRAFCKLHFGVPILRSEIPDFREKYDRLIRPRPYPEKLEMMAVPLDFPITRLMNSRQKTQYLDRVKQHFEAQGCQLTDPSEGFWDSLMEAAA